MACIELEEYNEGRRLEHEKFLRDELNSSSDDFEDLKRWEERSR